MIEAECILLEKYTEYTGGGLPPPTSWDCELTSDADVVSSGNRRFIQIDGLPDEIKAKAKSGSTTLLPGSSAKINNKSGRLHIPPGAQVSTGYRKKAKNKGKRQSTPGGGRPDGVGGGPPNDRRLAPAIGERPTIVVYVSNNGGAETPTYSKAILSNRVFGTDGDPVNLRSQYAACSADAVDFAPLTGNSNVATGPEAGVVTVNTTVPLTASDDSSDMASAVASALEDMFVTSFPFEHAIICTPPGTFPSNAVAWAYLDHWLSIYNDKWCEEVSALMHEVSCSLGICNCFGFICMGFARFIHVSPSLHNF